jgi:hypothetical protein
VSLSIDEVIAKLEAWREHDFHADRQLADEVLIADGWQCEPDPTFEGGVRWFWGTNPQVSSSESTRPHPINDLNAAVGVVPFKASWTLATYGGGACGSVTLNGQDGIFIGDAPPDRGVACPQRDPAHPPHPGWEVSAQQCAACRAWFSAGDPCGIRTDDRQRWYCSALCFAHGELEDWCDVCGHWQPRATSHACEPFRRAS